ncbi:hypothetical protein D1614_16695 [Maribellus luteus]|uniref:Uncharacterized protein n=1 Tax=Maribellus luteus TaxID=2305463 RepID=A0A399SSM4_9BACT|nr:hypothetical protein [Maribellus luteus]RIJ47066.1 hypothetical protein D1614_16695 [Maribellus luteus]
MVSLKFTENQSGIKYFSAVKKVLFSKVKKRRIEQIGVCFQDVLCSCLLPETVPAFKVREQTGMNWWDIRIIIGRSVATFIQNTNLVALDSGVFF